MQTCSISHSADSGAGLPYVERPATSDSGVSSTQHSTVRSAQNDSGVHNAGNTKTAYRNGGPWGHSPEISCAQGHQLQYQQSLLWHDRPAMAELMPSEVRVPLDYSNKSNCHDTHNIPTNVSTHTSHLTAHPRSLPANTSRQFVHDGAMDPEWKHNVFTNDDHRPFYGEGATNFADGGHRLINVNHRDCTSGMIAPAGNVHDHRVPDFVPYVWETPCIPFCRQKLGEPSECISSTCSRTPDEYEYAEGKDWSGEIPVSSAFPEQKSVADRMMASYFSRQKIVSEQITASHSLEQENTYERVMDAPSSEQKYIGERMRASNSSEQKNADDTLTGAHSCVDRNDDRKQITAAHSSQQKNIGKRMSASHSSEQKNADGKITATHLCVDRDDDHKQITAVNSSEQKNDKVKISTSHATGHENDSERVPSGEQQSAVAAEQPNLCGEDAAEAFLDDYEPLRIWANGMFAAEAKVRAEVEELTSQWKKTQRDVSQQNTRRDFIRERGIRAERRLGVSTVESESLLEALTKELSALESEAGELRQDIADTQRGHAEASSRSLKLFSARTKLKESLDVMSRDFEQLQHTVKETTTRVALEQQAVVHAQNAHDVTEQTLTRDKDALDDLRKTILILPDDISLVATSVADKERSAQELRHLADTWHSLTSDALQAFGAFQDTCRTDVERLEAMSAYSPRQDTSDPLVPFAHHVCDIQSDAEGIAQRIKWRSVYVEAMKARHAQLKQHKEAQKNCQDIKLEICATHNKMLERELESIVEEKRRLLARRQGRKREEHSVLACEAIHGQKKSRKLTPPSPQCTNRDNSDCTARICAETLGKGTTRGMQCATDDRSSLFPPHARNSNRKSEADQDGKAENDDRHSSSSGSCIPAQNASCSNQVQQCRVECAASNESNTSIYPLVVASPRATVVVKEAKSDTVCTPLLEMLPASHPARSTSASSSPRTREVGIRPPACQHDPCGPYGQAPPTGEPYAKRAQAEGQPFLGEGEFCAIVAKHAAENDTGQPEIKHAIAVPSAWSSGRPPDCTPPKLDCEFQAKSAHHATALLCHVGDSTEGFEQTRCENTQYNDAINTQFSAFSECSESDRRSETHKCFSRHPQQKGEQEASSLRHTQKHLKATPNNTKVPTRKTSAHLGATSRQSKKMVRHTHEPTQQTPSSPSCIHPSDAPFRLGTTADAPIWHASGLSDDQATAVSPIRASRQVVPTPQGAPPLETQQDAWVAAMVMRCDQREDVDGVLSECEKDVGDMDAPRHEDVSVDDINDLTTYERPHRERTRNAPPTFEQQAPADVSEFFTTRDDIRVGPPRRRHTFKSRWRTSAGNGDPSRAMHYLPAQHEGTRGGPMRASAAVSPKWKKSDHARRRGKWEGCHQTCEHWTHGGSAVSPEVIRGNSVARTEQTTHKGRVLPARTWHDRDRRIDGRAKRSECQETAQGDAESASAVWKKKRTGIRSVWRIFRKVLGSRLKN